MNAQMKISNRAGASFPVRRIKFNFDNVPEYWLGGSPGLTHFMTALSALFPDGEKLFIDAVRAVREHPSIKDDVALQKEISAFIGQEAMHTHEHVGFNQSAQSYGHNVRYLEKTTDIMIQRARKIFGFIGKPFKINQQMIDLTFTTALEHFTATIASQLLMNTEIQDLIQDETMYQLWMWHAVEENEHKAVAYDVFEGVFGKGLKSYALRTSAISVALVGLIIVQSAFTLRLLSKSKTLNVQSLKDILIYAYTPSKGIIAGMIPELLAYYRPGFHPNDLDTVQLLEDWKKKLGFEDAIA